MMEEVKPWWQSKTVWAALGIIANSVLSTTGVSPETVHEGVNIAFAAVALYGRIRAEKKLR